MPPFLRASLGTIFASSLVLTASAQLRVATYNISNYAGGREADLKTVFYGTFEGRSMSPDVVLTQEFTGITAANSFLNILNTAPGSPGDWSLATYVNGPDTDSACFYRRAKVAAVSSVVVATGNGNENPRNIMRYDVTLQGYSSQATRMAMYNVHMKASDTPADAERRRLEAVKVRDNAQTLARPFLIGGDLNIYRSSESGYVELTESQSNDEGRFFDPVKTPGDWNNTGTYRFLHSQDPIGAGGMDDRFDQILLGDDLIDGDGLDYIGDSNRAFSTLTWNDPNHSYRTWGNDGASFNTSLRTTGNTMVGATIATAIRNVANGAGHIPVFLDLRVPPEVGSPSVLDLGVFFQYQFAGQYLTISNAGDTALWGTNGIADLRYSLTPVGPFFAPGGNFTAKAGLANDHVINVDSSTPGQKTGSIIVSSNSPDEPIRTIEVRALVIGLGRSSNVSVRD